MGGQVEEAGRWSLDVDLQSSTEVAKVASTGPHRNACVVGAVCFRQSGEASSAAWRGQFLPVVNFSYSLK